MAHSQKHIPVLDGVRAFAVLLVMTFHFPKSPINAFESAIARLSMPGQTGVDLFFVLSGFLITGILLDSKGTKHYLQNFYIRRVLRIFPLYYGVLIVLYIVLPTLSLAPATAFGQQLWFWCYLQSVGFTFTHITGPNHFWSLAVEEHFYLLWPLLVMRWETTKLIRVLALAIVISLVARMVLISMGYGSFYFTLCRLDGLALGSLLAIAARSKDGLAGAAPLARRILVICGPLVGAAYVLASGSGLAVIQIFKSTIIGLFYAALLLLVLTARSNSPASSVLASRFLGSIGKYSYAMYVFHPFVFAALVPHIPFKSLVLQFLTAAAVTYLCAKVSWHILENPFLKLKHRFESGKERSPRVTLSVADECIQQPAST